ncbi:hypothetical protein R1flu_007841 [Riccia fluitans]|uniref:Uncharacterized protein n=1 Tax=Riccia fluitans TaxID=41844 RepID=A0ABD1Z003_9MARC
MAMQIECAQKELEEARVYNKVADLLAEYDQVLHNLIDAQKLNQELHAKNLALTMELREKKVQEFWQ